MVNETGEHEMKALESLVISRDTLNLRGEKAAKLMERLGQVRIHVTNCPYHGS